MFPSVLVVGLVSSLIEIPFKGVSGSMEKNTLIVAALWVALVVASGTAGAEEVADSLPVLKVPEGFSIELVAGPPLVERPIVASFDDEGRLYVAESSGSNDPVEKQLAERPHRIARLEDTDGDGKFDRRITFADRMMFPEGAMFLDGSLYVSAPPSIWKLTDTDGDGVADDRVEWFQGKTLTGCANDLHGPYAGPDGWIYWCKGAFAEQTHEVNGREWKTRAAHIFRCRPDGTGFEPVMTGGMDNPVDVVFTPEGERLFSATYFVGGSGRRDGIAHTIYGGVFGKDHGVLAGHPRTGDFMPMLVEMSAAAPCGLERYESNAFGPEYRDNLFLCQFNLRKVSRHVLRPEGSSFASEDSDFVWSENVDFHPTDVLMDADGSLLVLDTGGWYKLCCPTSQLWKPDVLGGIYRVRRVGAEASDDPRGQGVRWNDLKAKSLWTLMADDRPAVRQRASREFVKRRDAEGTKRFITHLQSASLNNRLWPPTPEWPIEFDVRAASLARLWTLSQIESADSRKLIREFLEHDDESIRHTALNAVSLYRDREATSHLIERLVRDTPANRRVAAEALGRIGDAAAVPHLLSAAATADDRTLRHSIIFALIELDDAAKMQAGVASDAPGTIGAALMAIDQMPSGEIQPDQVIPLLNSSDAGLRDTARWLVTQHTEWGGELADWFRGQLATLAASPAASDESASTSGDVLEKMLVAFAPHVAIQQLIAETVVGGDAPVAAREMALRAVAEARLSKPPKEWRSALARTVSESQAALLPLAVAAARVLPPAPAPDELDRALVALSDQADQPSELRVAALAVAAGGLPQVSQPQFELLVAALAAENPVSLRSAAADGVSRAHLSAKQLERLCRAVESATPLELNRLLAPFARSSEQELGERLLDALGKSPALVSLRVDLLREALAGYGPEIQQQISELESRVNVDAAVQRRRIEELLPLVSKGDERRGHAVYYSAKAACSACHRLGHAGGTIGPELTHIGETRTERDLLESILYPSLSFVRSFEPVLIVTVNGRTINGAIQDETAEEYVLVVGTDQEVRVPRDEVEEMLPSTVSIMPAGLDSQLTPQELADLVAFLKKTAER
jgi:putative membrane-bound dehydrogenase-like protein